MLNQETGFVGGSGVTTGTTGTFGGGVTTLGLISMALAGTAASATSPACGMC